MYDICQFVAGGGGCSKPREMSLTGNKEHSHLITEVLGDTFNIYCTDNFGNSNKKRITVYFDLS